jgi:transcription elongation factor GreA
MNRKMKETKSINHKRSSFIAVIAVGSTFTYQDDRGINRTYTISPNHEGNISKGVISPSSPLAQAVLGKQEGDTATVKAPLGNYNIKITKVEKAR